ncbi:hypothetical protein [Tessaracoccus sp.]
MTREQAMAVAVAMMSPLPWWGGRAVSAANATKVDTSWLVELVTAEELFNSPFALVREDGSVDEVAWPDALHLLGVL